MSIRLKLYMSYLAMVFLPLIMIFMVVAILLHAGGIKDIRQFLEVEQEDSVQQSIVYGELSYVIKHDPDQLLNEPYVNQLLQRLSDLKSGLFLSRNEETIVESPLLAQFDMQHKEAQLLDQAERSIKLQGYRYEKNVFHFEFSDGSEGTAVMLRRTDAVPIYWRPAGGIILLCFIGFTSILLTYYVSRSIINPIQELRRAALRMKEGDLSHKVVTTAGGEIGQLGTAFEEMRVRLNMSINRSLQIEEDRKMLLSHISHDLKTPISAIKGYVEGIMDGIANTEEKRKRYIQTIYQKAIGMDQLIDELFLYSKLDLQRVSYDFKTIDINKYLAYFLEEQHFDLEKEGIELIYRPSDAASLPVIADADKLSRVLLNILQNSVKYMDHEHKAIMLAVLVRDHDVLIRIQDTGPGIDEGDLPYIFDRFYRAEQSRNSETGGSGLGLAIVKQIIEGHGGKVWAENAKQGGAVFFITLRKAEEAVTVILDEENIDR